jgi:hypothetical protein
MKNIKKFVFVAISLVFSSAQVMAGETLLKPFVLASKGPGMMAEKVSAVKTALAANGFTVVGTYTPYPDAEILVVTSDELKSNAALSEHGGFGAIQRVAITKVKDEIQVSYTNPVYLANVYRMKGDLRDVAAKLQTALGRVEEFGAKGMTAADAREYHYMFGMEYFTDPSVLASYGSHAEALNAVEKGLLANKVGVTRIYRVDVPGKEESVFGVGLKSLKDDDKAMDDKFIMSEIDFRDIRSTAHLPYEVLVSGDKVYALYARFRIAISYPDLSMMGKNSFMNIMKAPEAIRKALQQAVSK